jgi:hypothetical protein
MTEPILAQTLPGRGRHYKHPIYDKYLPSVTNIIDVLAKPWLGAWMAKLVAEFAFDQRMALLEMDDREAAVDFLKGAPRRRRDDAAGLGDVLHEVARTRALGLPEPAVEDRHVPYIQAWEAWCAEYEPKFLVVEATVFEPDPQHGYAGTFDFLAEIDGMTVLGDYKTGSGVYDEVALQLAALRYARDLWDERTGEIRQMPDVDRCVVVHIRPEGARMHEVRADDDALKAFLGLRAAWEWVHTEGHVGPALTRARFARRLEVLEVAEGGSDG